MAGYLFEGGNDFPVCKAVEETDHLGQLIDALSKQYEILAAVMAKLETPERVSKEVPPVHQYKAVECPVQS